MPFDQSLKDQNFFCSGRNCTATAIASHASILVDCANYYRDLHESLTKARQSIFITGWDIDSRIELIRREEDRIHPTPVTLFELLTKKAMENPDLQIYLNKWDYAFFMAQIREPMSVWKWRKQGLPNIHYCHDNMVPFGSCQHQKIVVIDDEVAFIGGMDVAIARWDTRDHFPDDPHREDPDGLYNANGRRKFAPYHDIQTVVSGKAAQILAGIVRERWVQAAGYEAIPVRKAHKVGEVYQSWPDTDPPDFVDIPIAITRTLPSYNGNEGVYDIERAYLDQIRTAEKFIYMENQYFTAKKIAAALNQRMKERPDLRVVLVSSYDPQGFIEKVSMWAGRMRFKKILEEGIEKDQVLMAYPASKSRQSNIFHPVRIHSKIMAVDDHFLSIGSANLNNRSMRMDTECDLVYCGMTDVQKKKIASVRNDLIHEHSGFEEVQVAEMIAQKMPCQSYLQTPPESRKKFVEIDDSKFFVRFPAFLANALADPRKETIPEILPLPSGNNNYIRYISRRRIMASLLLIAIISMMAVFWNQGLFHGFGSRESLMRLFQGIGENSLSVPAAIATYALLATFFLPITILTAVSAVIFGYWNGFIIALSGALLSAAVSYGAANYMDVRKAKWLQGGAFLRVQQHAENSDVVGVTFLRMLPIAPYAVVNMVLGFLRVPFPVFMLGTFLGLLPGKVITVFLAGSVAELWKYPDYKNMVILGLGIAAWMSVVWMTHYFYRSWKSKTKDA